MSEMKKPSPQPGVCIPWEEKRQELARVPENEKLFKEVWENNDGFAYMYIWQVLLSF